MGTTIRREPVTFDIPASPAYKFLNITNFRGLDVSSNPFELSPNTASDCLNVYVDETNTLTTRPRLEKKIATPINGEHIGTYSLHNGYLLHYLVDGAGVMRKLVAGVSTEITGTIPTVKCKYFEQGDKIYLLDGERYMVISENVLNDVEGYVPTTSVVSMDGSRKDVESLNLLSEYYDEKYLWDGVSSIDLDDTDNLINETFVKKDILNEDGSNFLTVNTKIHRIYDDNSLLVSKDDTVYYVDATGDNATIISTGFTNTNDYAIRAATDNKAFWAHWRTITGISTITFYYQYYSYDELQNAWIADTAQTFMSNPRGIATDNTGDWLFILSSESGTSSLLIKRQDKNNYTRTSLTKYITTQDTLFGIVMTTTSQNTPAIAIGSRSGSALDAYGVEVYSMSAGAFVTTGVALSTMTSLNIFPKSNEVYVTGQRQSDSFPVLYTISCVDGSTEVRTFINVTSSFKMSEDKLYAWYTDDPLLQYDDETLSLHLYKSPMDGIEKIKLPETTFSAHALYFEPKKHILSLSFETGGEYLVWNTENKPNLTIRKLSSTNTEWLDKRTRLFKSYLNTRFDNNYWFVHKNRYYRSANNDPTYFPITEYNDLGDSNEDITGFNLANDTTLIAYKKNRVYLIQPFTSSLNTTEYTITESKNTVGNTAIGAPIVTTLTEIPLQINNDGIYGLSQLSNVSATERIADLMSEPINQRWLDVDDSVIERAITLNRLYWTYIILPYDTDTKIYLLDNRTNSWYYWELPIITSDAFVKDNHAEFVDSTGTIYYLTTTDIIDIAHEDEKVTKYYDDGERLIPWFWQSQILPMGTMNYSKRLVKTTFVLTDTDDSDGYGLQYNFRVFRKLASSTPEKEIVNKLTLVRSTTKKTNISKFGFLQIRLSNLTEAKRDYEAYENNKLRLVGLGLKYVLLEGLIA